MHQFKLQGVCVCAQLLSTVRLFVTPWIVACLAPLTMGYPKQEYWNRLQIPTPGDLPNSGIEVPSPETPALAADSLPLNHLESPKLQSVLPQPAHSMMPENY